VETVTEQEIIPREFWAALDAEPGCMTLRRALVDYLEENGHPAAECIRWTLEKGRVPSTRGWRMEPDETLAGIPAELWWAGDDKMPEYLTGHGLKCSRHFRRLVFRWSCCSPTYRQEFWNWNPEQEK
jgi:hypothetical protein